MCQVRPFDWSRWSVQRCARVLGGSWEDKLQQGSSAWSAVSGLFAFVCRSQESPAACITPGYSRLHILQEENQRDYKSFVLSKQLWDDDPEYDNKMLTWSSVDGSVTRMWAVPNPDGTAQGMLTLRKGGFEGLQQREDYAQLLSTKFAGINKDMLDAIAERCASFRIDTFPSVRT